MSAMSVKHLARSDGPEHTSAVVRLAGARDEQSRLGGVYAAAAGTQGEALARERLSAGRAYVASREQWLNWVDEGESLAPWADGEWGPELVFVPDLPEAERGGPQTSGIRERIERGEEELARAVAYHQSHHPVGPKDQSGASR
jgi:hypothetical protein